MTSLDCEGGGARERVPIRRMSFSEKIIRRIEDPQCNTLFCGRPSARVAELVDALASGASGGNLIGVRVPSLALARKIMCCTEAKFGFLWPQGCGGVESLFSHTF